jgi:tetratricopeptide (TPR) repeat protein
MALLIVLAGCAHAPGDVRALVNSGYAAALKGDAATTRRDYEKALAAEPTAKGHRVSYGWALFNLGLFDEALQRWRDAYAGVDREAANIEVCLALACHRTGRKAEALEWYAKQIARDERFSDAAGLAFVTSHWRPLEQETLQTVLREFLQRESEKRK